MNVVSRTTQVPYINIQTKVQLIIVTLHHSLNLSLETICLKESLNSTLGYNKQHVTNCSVCYSMDQRCQKRRGRSLVHVTVLMVSTVHSWGSIDLKRLQLCKSFLFQILQNVLVYFIADQSKPTGNTCYCHLWFMYGQPTLSMSGDSCEWNIW